MRLQKEQALALALALEQSVLDLGEFERGSAPAIDQTQHVIAPERPDRHVFQLRKGGGARRVEFELEAAGRRIDAEGDRAALVAVGIGEFPAADHLLGSIADRRRGLRLRDPGGKDEREQREKFARHGGTWIRHR